MNILQSLRSGRPKARGSRSLPLALPLSLCGLDRRHPVRTARALRVRGDRVGQQRAGRRDGRSERLHPLVAVQCQRDGRGGVAEHRLGDGAARSPRRSPRRCCSAWRGSSRPRARSLSSSSSWRSTSPGACDGRTAARPPRGVTPRGLGRGHESNENGYDG